MSGMRSLPERLAYSLLLWVETTTKRWLFGCSVCGQCVLSYTGYICPRRCPKLLSNGPCGGSKNGICELGDRPCVWYQIHARCSLLGRIDALDCYMPPLDWSLQGSASWLNHVSGRDAHISPQCEDGRANGFVAHSIHTLKALGRGVAHRVLGRA